MSNSFKKTLKKSAIFLFFLLVSFFTQAQVNLDSLWGVWNDETVPDSSRAQAIHKIAWDGYLYSQPDSAFYFAQLMYDFASNQDLKKMMAKALRAQGISYRLRGDYSTATEYYQKSYKISEGISDKKGMAGILISIGIICDYQGHYLKALESYQRSLKINEEISNKKGMAQALNNIGIIYDYQNDYPKALGYYLQSLEINEEMSNKRGMASSLNNVGLVYMNQGNYPKALEYFQRSLKIQEEISNKKGIASTLNNIGEIYGYQGDYSKALEYYHRSFKVNEEMSNKRGMLISMNSIGITNYLQGNYAQAITWCKKGLRMSEEIKMLKRQKNACQCLYATFKAMGNDEKALEYHERITMLDDSLQAEETAKKLQQMEFSKQMLADSLLQEKEKLRIQIAHEAEVRKKNRTRNIFILSALFLLFGAVGLYRRIVFVRRAKKTIENEKDRSDKLLLNILPEEIAEELKEKGRAEARNFEMVSILFTDFKEFTQISEKLSAVELVGEINTCFEAFDAICGKYGIEKIKTIGDSYMAAGGLPVPTDDSVKNTVLAGLEMAEFMINRKLELEAEGKISFEMRVGIHTGPVVAGIVGVKKFQYDIWGDTVNTASRMENSGEVGKVNISRSTYELIKEDPTFKFQSRGKVKAKGKGEMEMYFVSIMQKLNETQFLQA